MFVSDRQKQDIREAMRTLLRYHKQEYLEIDDIISRMRGITMVLAHMGVSEEMRLGHRVISFLLTIKWKKRKK